MFRAYSKYLIHLPFIYFHKFNCFIFYRLHKYSKSLLFLLHSELLYEIQGMYITRNELSCLKGTTLVNNTVCIISKIIYDFEHVVTSFII